MSSRWTTVSVRRSVVAALAVGVLAVGGAACGGDDVDLSEEAQRGRETANNNGCASCHGANGQGGVGPGWVDLAGSEVEIKVPEEEGGGTEFIVADDEYLRRAILDPSAEEVVGFSIAMPENMLTEEQADEIVAYIKELTSDDG